MKPLEFENVCLAIDEFGDPEAPPVVLIAGATQSMDWWDPGFCAQLAAQGLYVIRYDQRDTGQSTTCPPRMPDYTGADLATDPLRILDGLHLPSAHFVGLSMGGGIAQHLGVHAAPKVRSLTLIESSPAGGEHGPLPSPDARIAESERGLPAVQDWSDAAETISYRVEAERPYAGSSGFDEERFRAIATTEVSRSTTVESSLINHFLVTESSTTDPAQISAPTLIIHSESDPLFPLPHGEALARMIPHATMLRVKTMGHEAPPPDVWGIVVPALADHVRNSEGVPRAVKAPAEEPPERSLPSWLAQTRVSYDDDGIGYSRQVEGILGDQPHLRAHLDLLAEHVQHGGAGPVADIGCGTGYATRYLHDAGIDAFGIDLSSTMVEIARRDHPDLHFEAGTMTNLDLASDSLAGLIAFWSTIHIPDHSMPHVIAEFSRIVRPGGHVLVGFHVGDAVEHSSTGYSGRDICLDTYLREVGAMSGWLRDAGFRIDSETVFRPDDDVPGAIVLAHRIKGP